MELFFVTSVEEVVFTLFVCLLAGLHKLYSTDFQQNSESCYAMVRVLVTVDVPRHIHQDCVIRLDEDRVILDMF